MDNIFSLNAGDIQMTYRKYSQNRFKAGGFTILEAITVLSILALLGMFSVPLFVQYYHECCVKVAMSDIVNMVREAKMKALDEKNHAIVFDAEKGTVTLYSEFLDDGKWNINDTFIRSIHLKNKGGGLRFGCGTYGPIPGHVAPNDGITFPRNTAVFNDRLSSNAGTVYIITSTGAAMAVVVNSVDAGYALWRWNGKKWVRN
jgi:hypothetical protein